jgi:hypothetical protein
MGTPVFSVTQRNQWKVAEGPAAGGGTSSYFLQFTTAGAIPFNALSPPGAYAYSKNIWLSTLASNTDAGQDQRIVLDVSSEQSSLALFKFFGRPDSDPENPSAQARSGMGAIWGVSALGGGGPPDDEYLGDYLGSFELTQGAVQATGTTALPTSPLAIFGRRATVSVDRAAFPGMRAVGEYPLSREVGGQETLVAPSPALVVDTLGYWRLIVELRSQVPIGASGAQGMTHLGFAYRLA